MAGEAIVLGEGAVYIGDTPIGLTRGGSQFVVTREYRRVNADGDRGPVKGRIRLVESVATLQVNQLEIMVEDLAKLFPATQFSAGEGEGLGTFTGKPDIETSDYNDTVKWIGKTMDGRRVVITLHNAINLENLSWTMAERDEIVQQITFTATYDPTKRLGEEEPWDVQFVEAGSGEGEEV